MFSFEMNRDNCPKFDAVHTVGELKAVLAKLPDDLPLNVFDDGIKPVVFNWTHDDVHLALEDNDGCWDDLEDDQDDE